MLKNKTKLGLMTVALWLILSSFQFSAQAATADTTLEIRDRCNEWIQCPVSQETSTQIKSAVAHSYDEEFSLDVYIKNPSQQDIISAQTWLKYDNQKLEVLNIDTSNSAFDFVAPGENNFDQAEGLIKIGRSAIGTKVNTAEIFVANITFKVLTKDPDTALLEFYDYQISESGHTSVRIMEDSYPVNVLEKGPKSFIVTLNKDWVVDTGNTTNTNTNTNQNQEAVSPLALARPTGLKATTGNGYIFLVWDKLDDANLKGYNLYYSSMSGRYLQRRPVGNVNQYEMNNLENWKTYYFAITAHDSLDRETDYSDEIRITVGDVNSSSSPILISREDYLTKVPEQPQNGPAMMLIITFIAMGMSFLFVKTRNYKIT